MSPGSKSAFDLGFVKRMAPLLAEHQTVSPDELGVCASCGGPTPSEVCSFCKLTARVGGREPVPVELVLNKRARAAYQASTDPAPAERDTTPGHVEEDRNERV